MGIAPRVAGLEKFPGGIGNRIEMADVRSNFEPHGDDTQWSLVAWMLFELTNNWEQLALKRRTSRRQTQR